MHLTGRPVISKADVTESRNSSGFKATRFGLLPVFLTSRFIVLQRGSFMFSDVRTAEKDVFLIREPFLLAPLSQFLLGYLS
jgi:hypothetical protein